MRVRCHTNQAMELVSGATGSDSYSGVRPSTTRWTIPRILPKASTSNSALVIGGSRALQAAFPKGAARSGLTTSDIPWRSSALTFIPLPGQLRNRAREGRLEVDQLRPGRGHDDPDHAVIERADLGLPLDPLLGRHRVGAVHLEELIRDAVDDVQLGLSADEQDARRVLFGVDGQGYRWVVSQGRNLRGVLGGAHDDRRPIPG